MVLIPWAGSYYVEYLTGQLTRRAWSLIQEIEDLGGMAKAIENGLPKLRIEEAAARKQARIDSGKDRIVGVNIFPPETETDIDVLTVDNTAVRESQVKRLVEVKSGRDAKAVESALAELTACAENGKGNLLAKAVEAARHRATLGEISLAMEKSFGRYVATTRSVSGVYAKEISMDKRFRKTLELSDRFAELEGRQAPHHGSKAGTRRT